jgi:hypothetical protein
MLNVVCVHFRDAYADVYVDRLYSMTRRHLSLPFRFTCVTDRIRPLHPDIVQLQRDDIIEGRGSRNKLQLFDPTCLPYDSMLYMDLTLFIRESLDSLIEWTRNKDFVTIRDWNYESFNSCVMWIRQSERVKAVWDTYTSGKQFSQKIEGGDQDYIYSVFKENGWLDTVDYFPPETIAPFRGLLRMSRTDRQLADQMISEAAIIKFHGRPKPHEWLDPISRFRYLICRKPLPISNYQFLVKETQRNWR